MQSKRSGLDKTILFGASDGRLCSTWLCTFPAMALSAAGYSASVLTVRQIVEQKPPADIVILERTLFAGAPPDYKHGLKSGPVADVVQDLANLRVHDTIREYHSRGSRVIGVFDDHYMSYPSGPQHVENSRTLWLEGTIYGVSIGYKPIEQFLDGLRLVDAVMVPSRYLANVYGPYARQIFYVRNRPYLEDWPVVHGDTSTDRVVVGLSGTEQHWYGWKDHVVLDVLAAFRDRIVVLGILPEGIAHELTRRGVTLIRRQPADVYGFQSVVGSYDIGICPLSGEYDRGRSWIKWLECSLQGVPVIAEDNGVYDECEGGLRVSGYDGWYTALRRFIRNADERLLFGIVGRRWAWQQGWTQNLDEITTVLFGGLNDRRGSARV